MKTLTRNWIGRDGETTVTDARSRAEEMTSAVKEATSKAEAMMSEAKKVKANAESAAKGARKTARKQVIRARVAAARTTASRPKVDSKKTIAVAGVAGAAGAFFLDPQQGARRRHMVRDRAEAMFRKATAKVRRQIEYRKHRAEGKLEALKSKARPEKPAPNDQDLADRVKSQILQPADAPKGAVNINVEHGVVYLRGQVDRREEIEKLVKQARSVEGVRGVENLISR
jgi:osmotically-inducible protein OsmY